MPWNALGILGLLSLWAACGPMRLRANGLIDWGNADVPSCSFGKGFSDRNSGFAKYVVGGIATARSSRITILVVGRLRAAAGCS